MNKRSAKIQPATNEDLWTAVDRYITDLLVRPDDSLDAALKASAAAGLPAINVSPPQGKFLMLLAQILGARNILDQHEDEMSRFFSQMRVILGVLQNQESDLTGLLKYAPFHDRNTQMVEYLQNNQVYQDFVVCGANDDPSDPARSCNPG